MSTEQHVTAHAGFAYGVIGADLHVFGDGSPVYLLHDWRPAPAAGPDWLRELPSRMLNARFEVVPFTGREAELAELRAWRDEGPRLAVRWTHAPGGQGKTRLAARFAEETQGTGWRVITAVHGPGSVQPPPGSEDVTVDGHAGVLLVVDYADRWPLTHLTWLLRNAVLHRPGVRTRVLLLARTADAWPAVRSAFRNIEAATSSRLLAELPDTAMMYGAARTAFAERYGLPPAPGPPPPPYGLTLALHMAALVDVDATASGRHPPPDLAGLTVYLLDREHLHWATLHARGGPHATPPAAMNRAVFAAALTGTLDRPTASAVVAGLGTGHSPGRVLDDHAYCYPAAEPGRGTVLEPLYPDRLAEDFLALTLPGHDADYPAMAWAPEVTARLLGPHAGRAVTFLAAAAQRWPHVGPRHLYPPLAHAPRLALAAGSAALSALAALDDIPLALLAAIEDEFPAGGHVELNAGMAALTRRVVAELLARDGSPRARAAGYHHLSTRLLNAGLDDEALDAARRSVDAARELDDVPELAASLGRLGDCLTHNGRPSEALRATEEAAALLRPLTEAAPARHEPQYAGLLTDLARRLAAAGRHREALVASESATARWRRLAAADPSHTEGLASALQALGGHLNDHRRWDEGLAATRESASLRLALAEGNMAAHEPHLVSGLVTLAASLAALGEQEMSLKAARQAVESLRALARTDPAAHEPGLAAALMDLGATLSEAGLHAEALDATAESVAVRRRLHRTNPGAHARDLASVLSNLSHLLLEAGRPDEALAAAGEGVQLLDPLHTDTPEIHRADLAKCVSLHAVCLVATGRHKAGLVMAVRAVRLYEAAWQADPERHGFDLARVLRHLGLLLADSGHDAEALGVWENALALAEAYGHVIPPACAGFTAELRGDLDAVRARTR
ncbi:hypothetical protein ACH4MA_20790 [Streptomyces roseolus]|uniref:hypothetical protein n=1 Tax=Streptomyces roseolus TaxID=67358 RepID=UPI0037A51DCF